MRTIADNEIVAAVRAALPDVEAVYLFGSFAAGRQNEESDLDVAIVTNGRLERLRLWNARCAISNILDIDVDLVEYREVDTLLQHQILVNGRRIYGESDDLDLYDVAVLSEMTSLQERLQPLLADIIRDGSVYGRK